MTRLALTLPRSIDDGFSGGIWRVRRRNLFFENWVWGVRARGVGCTRAYALLFFFGGELEIPGLLACLFFLLFFSWLVSCIPAPLGFVIYSSPLLGGEGEGSFPTVDLYAMFGLRVYCGLFFWGQGEKVRQSVADQKSDF